MTLTATRQATYMILSARSQHGGDWDRAPKAVKAKALRMGLTLTGKRQLRSEA